MIDIIVLEKFGLKNALDVKPLSNGLINNSFKVALNDGDSYFLQNINQSVFPKPLLVQKNYSVIQNHLAAKHIFNLPEIVLTVDSELVLELGDDCWRCMNFLNNTYSPSKVTTADKAFETATCFAKFTAGMNDVDPAEISIILPQFHDLDFRYQQLLQARKNAKTSLLEDAKDLLAQTEKFIYLLEWFRKVNADKTSFPLHIMHHDCKIANILFRKDTDALVCPVDFDTTQPGLFFSDPGDMVRTMVSSTDENDPAIKSLDIRSEFYNAVVEGYMSVMHKHLTTEEKSNIHFAGSILIYMQAIRFLADYLNENIYYKVSYPEQNKYRAANQFRLLELLENYLIQQKLHA